MIEKPKLHTIRRVTILELTSTHIGDADVNTGARARDRFGRSPIKAPSLSWRLSIFRSSLPVRDSNDEVDDATEHNALPDQV